MRQWLAAILVASFLPGPIVEAAGLLDRSAIVYGAGISKVGELIDLGVRAGIVEKSGAWFSHGGERIGQGRENAKQYLVQHPDVAVRIEAQIRQNAGLIGQKLMSEKEPEPAEAED